MYCWIITIYSVPDDKKNLISAIIYYDPCLTRIDPCLITLKFNF